MLSSEMLSSERLFARDWRAMKSLFTQRWEFAYHTLCKGCKWSRVGKRGTGQRGTERGRARKRSKRGPRFRLFPVLAFAVIAFMVVSGVALFFWHQPQKQASACEVPVLVPPASPIKIKAVAVKKTPEASSPHARYIYRQLDGAKQGESGAAELLLPQQEEPLTEAMAPDSAKELARQKEDVASKEELDALSLSVDRLLEEGEKTIAVAAWETLFHPKGTVSVRVGPFSSLNEARRSWKALPSRLPFPLPAFVSPVFQNIGKKVFFVMRGFTSRKAAEQFSSYQRGLSCAVQP